MGKIENGYIKGLVGGIVARRLGNTQVVQSRSRLKRSRQTLATKAAAVDFGNASKSARMIRYAFWQLILGYHDPAMINRLNQQVLRTMRANTERRRGTLCLSRGNPGRLKGFQFNEASPLGDQLFVDVDTFFSDGRLLVRLPEFDCDQDLIWPYTATHCTIRLQVYGFDFPAGRTVGLGNESFSFPLRSRKKRVDSKQWTFDVSVVEGMVVMAGMSIEFDREMDTRPLLLNNKNYHPAALVEVFSV